MTLVGLLCVLGAIVLLAAGLAQGDWNLVRVSIAASALGGVAVVVAALQRDRALRRSDLAADRSGGLPIASEAPSEAPEEVFQPEGSPEDSIETGEGLDPVDEPAQEDVDIADVLTVLDLVVPVFVVDLRPRYHLEGCEHLHILESIPIPVNEARKDGFTPCGLCRPDAALASAARRTRSYYG
ncbi:hypothetical protein BH24ACT9_BH24ACT9_06790 [soil metagenome]